MSPANEEERRGEEGNDRRFRIFFRGFLLLCLIPATFVIFDGAAPSMHRVVAGILWPTFAFMFFAVGRPPSGRIYTLGIALFCFLLAGVGTVGCLLDTACVPVDKGLVALFATGVAVFCRSLDLRFPPGAFRQLLARCATIGGLTAAFYVSYYYRAFGGALMFLVFGVLALGAAFDKGSDTLRAEPPKPAPVEPHSPIVLAAASAAYWFGASARGPLGAWLILGAGTAWLLYTIHRFRKTRPVVSSARR